MPSRSRESSARCTRAPDWLVLHDISTDGRVLLSRNTIRINAACQAPGEATERDLGWLVASFANGLSPDGQTLIFSDGLSGRTPAGNTTVFRRSTDGSPAVSLGEARGGGALSPDGRWVLAELEGNLILLPAGAGSTVTLPKGDVVQFGRGAWLGDSKRIVFTGDPGDGKPRGYIQEIPAGLPRAITPVGVSLAGKAAVRDDNSILGRVGADVGALSDSRRRGPAGASAQAWRHPASMEPRRPIRVYASTTSGVPGRRPLTSFASSSRPAPGCSGRRSRRPDPVGVEGLRDTVVITPDARSYCYSYMRRLGDLFVVDGLK